MGANKAKPHNDAVHLATLENIEKALQLRRAGASLRAIAQSIGVSHETVRTYLTRALENLHKSQNESAELTRAMELDRLDRQYMALWPLATADGNPDISANAMLLRIAERRAKLLGLDAPTRTQIAGDDGSPLTIRIVHD